jgi:hypothetical protein
MQNGAGDAETDLLEEVYLNGDLKVDYTLADIRGRATVTAEEAQALDLNALLVELKIK